MSLRSSLFCVALAALTCPSHAQGVSADFDGATGVPSGFLFVENGTNGGSTFSIASDAGSTGAGDDAGLVTAEIAASGNMAGGWLSSLQPFDATLPFAGSFRFYLASTAGAADATLQFTGSPDATFSGWKAELSNNTSFARLHPVTNGTRNPAVISAIANLDPLLWYDTTFTWTPSNGTTGRLTCSIDALATGTSVGGFDTASIGPIVMPPVVHIGFGSNNDPVRFDDIQLTGTSSSALLANPDFESPRSQPAGRRPR